MKLLEKILKLQEEAYQRSQRDFELITQQLQNKKQNTYDLYKPNEDYLTRDQVSEMIDEAIKGLKTMSKEESNILNRNDEINLETNMIQEEETNDLGNFFIWNVIKEGIKFLGMAPPNILSSNSKSCPLGKGSIFIFTSPY